MAKPEQEPAGRVVSGQRVRETGARVRIPIPGHEEPAAQPVVELVREGDVVRAIDIRCGCGQTIRVVCDYGEPGS